MDIIKSILIFIIHFYSLQIIFRFQHKFVWKCKKKERKSPNHCDLSPTIFYQNLEPYVSFCQFYLRKRNKQIKVQTISWRKPDVANSKCQNNGTVETTEMNFQFFLISLKFFSSGSYKKLANKI